MEIKNIVKRAMIAIFKKSFRQNCYGHIKNCRTNECLNKTATTTVEETKKKGQMGRGSIHVRVYVY